MKFNIRWFFPIFIFLASPLFADELQYDDGSPELGYTNGSP